MKLTRLFILGAAALCLASCEKDPLEQGNGNWWFQNGLVTGGIKTIVENGYTTTYDKNGRPISMKGVDYEETITYNSDGLPSKIESTETVSAALEKTTQTFEYSNGGKFCPMMMSPGFVFHVFYQGLVPGLSKITWESKSQGTIVSTYTFQGDKLVIHTTGGADYKDVEIEYKGVYPYQMNGEMEFFGPLTYQENGMFDTYREGFVDSETGIMTMDRTLTVNKNFKNKMIPEKEVGKWYNSPSGELYNTETITYTYNEHGDCIKEVTVNTCANCDTTTSETTYEYDSKGNWIKSTTRVSSTGGFNNTYSNQREITYY